MKKTGLLSIFLILILLVSGCEKAADDRVVGTVQGENIYFWELSFFLDSVKTELLNQANISGDKEIQEFWKNSDIDGVSAAEVAKSKAFQQAVLFKSKVILAKKSGETLSDDTKNTIQKQIADAKTSLGGDAAFKETLSNMGINESNYKQLLEDSALVNNYFSRLAQDGTISVSDEAMNEYYNAHLSDYRTTVTAKHILFATVDENKNPKSEEEQKKAAETAKQVYDEIAAGTLDFDTAMQEYSEDPGLKSNPDGYTFTRGKMIKEFENAAFDLEVGQVSEPVKSSFGWHIIKLTDAKTSSFDEVKNDIYQTLASSAFDDYAKQQSASFKITKDDSVINTVKF